MRYIKVQILLLLLQALVVAQPYRGAELRTLDYFQYGRFAVSMKSAQGNGILSTLFTYNDQYPATNWAEIDIEVLGRWSDNVDFNVIDENGSHLRQNPMNINVHLDYHEYAFEWTPDYVAWFFDGEELYRQNGEHIQDLFEPGKFMMNSWRPAYEDWTGVWDERVLPRFTYYEWAEYAEYTPGAGDMGSNNDFSLSWRDEFNDFDSTRWEKSDDHTWPGNNALLVADNIVYQDGKMILCLTMPDALGFQDHSKPYPLWARALSEGHIVVKFTEELDAADAQNTDNYVISGVNINSAELREDQLSVDLYVNGLDLDGSYNLFVLGIRDQATPPNTQLGASVPIILPDPLELPLRINSAGPDLNGFKADQWWSAAVEYGHDGGNYQLATWYPDLAGTEYDSVMASSLNRFSRYYIRLEPGIFDLDLHFAEHFYDEVGERVFELYLEGELVEPALDVYAEVGNTGLLTLSFEDLEVLDGRLDILCAATTYGVGYAYAGPVLNALEIDGELTVHTREEVLAAEYRLKAIYPNPFNNATMLEFVLSQAGNVRVDVLDLKGRNIGQILDRHFSAGEHSVPWIAAELASGVYVLKFSVNGYESIHKALLIR